MSIAHTTHELCAQLPQLPAPLAQWRAALCAPLPANLQDNQFAQHGRAWAATYIETLTQLIAWHSDYRSNNITGNTTGNKELIDELVVLLCGEYLNQLAGGIIMSQSEIVRPADMGFDTQLPALDHPAILILRAHGNSHARRRHIAALLNDAGTAYADCGLDETHTLIRAQFHRFAQEKIVPHAHRWHLTDTLIPLDVIDAMAEMGVFGITIPEEFGGTALGKLAMCVVSEELSRAYIGVGSLGTRTDIAAELIFQNGTDAQKQYFLPAIASGKIIPTAVFTEPDIGSDLAHLTSRAEKVEGGYRIYGAKTWITHGGRADLMTLLVRTDTSTPDHNGLSMLLAEKPRGTADNPFPADGMAGSEIGVLGYRGMKEYDIAFDGFFVPQSALLGGVEGMGFRQLMKTFESARIQTAARAIGVAQAAADAAFAYARERQQFSRSIYEFDRVSGKIVMMVAEILAVRRLSYYATKCLEQGERCDLQAGMAKLLAARVAWAAADNGVQIHGGNGFALEYPISRILCDARILSIFEGAAEIQADIIARRLQEQAQ